jgi:superfamily II DNA/RNA helicase
MYAIVLRDQLQSQRFISNSGVLELTSRTRSDEVPAAIDALKVEYLPGKKDSLDVCLASNIIEVGIDIDRLGLLVIAGQPKTTSQYIQVSGRVGRNWEKAPGLVVTVYSPLKPRDRSHFEKFKSYHQKMYQFVEATSVTPFSDPLLERAMHAVMVGHVRLSNPSSLQPFPYPAAAITEVENLIRDAVARYQPNDLPKVNKWLQDRSEEWRDWEKTKWNDRDGDTRQALMRPTEALIQSDESRLFWPTPNSLRNVDVECLLQVYNFAHMDSNFAEAGED